MKEFNFKLQYASLIPEFIYQFLSNEYIMKNSFTCFELEDLREVIINKQLQGLFEIKKFLAIDESTEEINLSENINEDEILEEELKEIDDEYYHKYTPGELRFIFDEIIKNIDEIYLSYKEYFDINMSFTIGFKMINNIDANMIVEFLSTAEEPGYIKNAYFIPVDNQFVSDETIARIYFYLDEQKVQQTIDLFNKIFELLELR